MRDRSAWQVLVLLAQHLALRRYRHWASRGWECRPALLAGPASPRGFLPGPIAGTPDWFPEYRRRRSRHRGRKYSPFHRKRVLGRGPEPGRFLCTWDRPDLPGREQVWPPDAGPASRGRE